MLKLDKLKRLQKEVENCRKCSLWKNRKKVAFGEGPESANIFLIGLGPGRNENLHGRPFVGAAGKLLNHLLTLANLRREHVYITSVMKCYLPNNKATREQINACKQYLDRQLGIIRPSVIIPLGSVALQYLSEKFNVEFGRISKVHGRLFNSKASWGKIKIVPMYHPAAALRNGALRKTLEADWKKFERVVRELTCSTSTATYASASSSAKAA